jgi:hypothetical protein
MEYGQLTMMVTGFSLKHAKKIGESITEILEYGPPHIYVTVSD